MTDSLREGDVVFRCGQGLVSRAVLLMNGDFDYSHVGVLVSVDRQWFVVHSVPYEGRSLADDHIYCEPIGGFFDSSKAVSGAVYRWNIDSLQLFKIKDYLMDHVDVVTPFDHDYDLSDDRALYCSELVWRAFLCAGVDLTNDHRSRNYIVGKLPELIITPSDIAQNSGLELVIEF